MVCSQAGTGAHIRDARPDEAAAMADLHLRAVRVGYDGIFPADAPMPATCALRAGWQAALRPTGRSAVLVAVGPSGEVTGTVAVRPFSEDPRLGQIQRLHVEPSVWGQGIGSALHDAGLARLRLFGFTAAVLWVLEGNVRARKMYERRGWALVHGARLVLCEGVAEAQYRLDLREA
jgi:ribosomal protein S18 acetylase RimI-like enzyme